MNRIWKAIRYSSISTFFAGIVMVLQGCTIEREGVLGIILLLLLQFCSGPVDTSTTVDLSGLDFVVVPDAAETQICKGNGNGSFVCTGTGVTVDSLGNENSATGGDFNEDGHMDFVAPLDQSPAEFCAGDGTGAFVCNGIGATFIASSGGMASATGDFNKDDHLDFVALLDNTNAQLCAGDGAGAFACGNLAQIFNANTHGMTATGGDFNEDTNPDFFVAGDAVPTQLCAGNGAGTFTCSNVGINFAPASRGIGSDTADFNRDNDLDVVVVPNNQNAHVCFGDGAGAFICQDLGFSFTTGSTGMGVGAGDFDNDGNADFVVYPENNTPNFCKGDGSGNFACSPLALSNIIGGGVSLPVVVGEFVK